MQRFKFVAFMMFVLAGAILPSISQAQWEAQGATYVKHSEGVIQRGSGHYEILTGSQWGGVNCFADPPTGGACDVEVTINFVWKWTGNISQITDLVVTPNGDLVGDGPWPGPSFFLTSVGTFGLTATADSNMAPGPYNFAPPGQQDTFTPQPPSPIISVSGQCHSIAQLSGGPFTTGASARSSIYW